MPAASEESRFRPLGVRVAAVLLGGLLVAVVAVVWLAFPAEVRDKFTTGQRVTVLLFGLAALLAAYALARSRVEVRDDGLLVVNGLRSRTYPWAEVRGVTLRAGAPWALLELADGSTAPAMGVQGSDGDRAVRQVRRLRELIAAHRVG
jgi:hypothetical protein